MKEVGNLGIIIYTQTYESIYTQLRRQQFTFLQLHALFFLQQSIITLRTFDEREREIIHKRIRNFAADIDKRHGVRTDVDIRDVYKRQEWGSAESLPLAPAVSSTAPIEAASPVQMVATSELTSCIVS